MPKFIVVTREVYMVHNLVTAKTQEEAESKVEYASTSSNVKQVKKYGVEREVTNSWKE